MPDPSANPHRLPRTVVPRRYDLTLEPDLEAATLRRQRDHRRRGADRDERGGAQRRRDGDRRGDRRDHHRGRNRWRTAGGHRGARRRRRAGHAHLRPAAPRRRGGAPPALPGRAQRQAAGLLPVHVHRRRRRRAGAGHHPDGGHRRPAGVPLLGRARRQGRLRRDPRRARGPAGHLQRRRAGARPGRRDAPTAEEGGDPVRRHDAHVHLPGGVRRGAAGGHRPGRRRRQAPAGRVPHRQGAPRRLRARGRRLRPALLQRLVRHRLSGRQARPRRHPRLRLRRHGEPRLRHVPGALRAGRPGHVDAGRAAGGGRCHRATRSRTCGSATW